MKIAIVGAGASGLVSIRNAQKYGVDCVAYEISENIGGTWVYYENVRDELRDQLPTSMYYSLRTNLPTCLMEFRDYKFQPESEVCYPGHAEVLKYLQDFARDFQLLPHIKFSHKVINISQKNEKWSVTVKNLKSGQNFEEEFDGVMVGSGHHSEPSYPNIPGQETFCGYQVHSCYYKKNNFYKDKTVLMIGKGPSALDLCREVALVANKVYLSHHGKPLHIRPKNVDQKPGIVKIDNFVVHFEDNTTASVDSIIYCTGYLYNYPFLDSSCGIENRNMIIYPLYKNFINARHPTMCINGLLQKTIAFQLLDLQAEVFIKTLTGRVKLPSTEEMLIEVQKEYDEKLHANVTSPYYYYLDSEKLYTYFHDLYKLGHCKPFPPVIFDIFDKNHECLRDDFDNLRNQVYEVIDDRTYTFRLNTENGYAAGEDKKNEN